MRVYNFTTREKQPLNLREYQQMYRLETSHWYFVGKNLLIRKLLRALFPAERRLRLLDVGCGTGNILNTLEEFGEAVGIDASAVALEFCKSRNLKNLYLSETGTALPFEDAEFDVVCAFDFLEHLDDDLALLAEMKRVCRPNLGKILIIVPAHPFLWSEHDVALHHKRRYTSASLRKLVHSAGLRIVRKTYLNTLLFPAAAGYRVLKKVLPSKPHAEAHSEFFVELPRPVNWLLLSIFRFEGLVAPKVNLPFGLSLFLVCEYSDPITAHGRARSGVSSRL